MKFIENSKEFLNKNETNTNILKKKKIKMDITKDIKNFLKNNIKPR